MTQKMSQLSRCLPCSRSIFNTGVSHHRQLTRRTELRGKREDYFEPVQDALTAFIHAKTNNTEACCFYIISMCICNRHFHAPTHRVRNSPSPASCSPPSKATLCPGSGIRWRLLRTGRCDLSVSGCCYLVVYTAGVKVDES
ncbi:hypothetical protein D9C73_026180 [Collichthys lucidus]|uniref:Uncharacterized protein n=1 Tax=Collichthys lucidus TaxID=240159 RepID=A0A4U5VTH9_COLLU|nr:hypothetical protein D9C73_026180 [Collichthys lucidus]